MGRKSGGGYVTAVRKPGLSLRRTCLNASTSCRLPAQKVGFSAQAEWSLKVRKADSPGRVWGSPISGPRGTPNRDLRNTCFCRRRLSPGHFPEAGGQVQGPEGPDLNGSCKEGWDPQGSGGAERKQREALKPAPLQGALQCPHTVSGHLAGMQGPPILGLAWLHPLDPKERGKPMMTPSPKHASLESVALGVFTD